jgi:hypothetical protein
VGEWTAEAVPLRRMDAGNVRATMGETVGATLKAGEGCHVPAGGRARAVYHAQRSTSTAAASGVGAKTTGTL